MLHKIFYSFITCFLSGFYLIAQPDFPIETILQQGHTKTVTSANFSPDGKYIVSGGKDNNIIVWNAQSGKEIRTYNYCTAPIISVDFSHSGTELIAASTDNTVRIFNVLTGAQELLIDLKNKQLYGALFSPGDSLIMIQTDYGNISYWNRKGEKKQEFERTLDGIITKTDWSPESNWIVHKENYKSTLLIDRFKNDTLRLTPEKMHNYSFSPDGKYWASGSAKLKAEVFDLSTGKLLHTLIPDEEQKCDGCNTIVEFSPQGTYLALGSSKIGITLWNPKNRKKTHTLTTDNKRVRYIRFSPNEKHLLVATADNLFVYDIKSGKLLHEFKSPLYNYFEAFFSPDGQSILLPDNNNTVTRFSVIGKKLKTFKGYTNQSRTDGLRFDPTSYWDSGILKHISLKSSVAVSPDGKYMVRGNQDSIAQLINIETGKVVRTFKGHSKVVYCYAFSPNGKYLATGGGDHKILLWDMEAPKDTPPQVLSGHREVILDIRFSSDNQQIISTAWDGMAIIWNFNDLENVRWINTNGSPICASFTPDNLYLAIADLDKELQLREGDALAVFKDYIGHTDLISDIDFISSTNRMVTSSRDGSVKIWDIGSGMVKQKFRHPSGEVYTVAVSKNEQLLISAGADRIIYGWDLISGKLKFTLSGHINAISHLEFIDSQKFVSVGVDGAIKIWDLPEQKELYTYYPIDRNNWLAKNPTGYFDGSPKALKLVNYVSGMEAISVGSLFEKYYTPGLIQRISSGESFSSNRTDLQHYIVNSPVISVSTSDTKKRLIHFTDNDSHIAKDSVFLLTVTAKNQGKKIEEIRIYNNGKLIVQTPLEEEIVFRGGDGNSRTFDVKLNSGTNQISVIGIDQNRTESAPIQIQVNYDGKAAQTDLFLLAIGINEYQNPSYHLNYAVNDAKSFAKEMKGRGDTLFSSIHTYFIKDEKAIKQNIQEQIIQIQKEIGPEDVFIFYYAGHGVLGIPDDRGNADFFIVTQDVTNLYGSQESLAEKAISAKELLDFSKNIAAEKQVFVLDACHSGGALEAFAQRGAGREKALAQLARSSGTYFLTASQDIQFANEATDLKHGLFTYSLLEALQGKGNTDEKVTISEIKSYVEDRVPELSQQYHGSPQYPSSYNYGQDFPIVIIER